MLSHALRAPSPMPAEGRHGLTNRPSTTKGIACHSASTSRTLALVPRTLRPRGIASTVCFTALPPTPSAPRRPRRKSTPRTLGWSPPRHLRPTIWPSSSGRRHAFRPPSTIASTETRLTASTSRLTRFDSVQTSYGSPVTGPRLAALARRGNHVGGTPYPSMVRDPRGRASDHFSATAGTPLTPRTGHGQASKASDRPTERAIPDPPRHARSGPASLVVSRVAPSRGWLARYFGA